MIPADKTGMPADRLVAGVDGCRTGWVVAVAAVTPPPTAPPPAHGVAGGGGRAGAEGPGASRFADALGGGGRHGGGVGHGGGAHGGGRHGGAGLRLTDLRVVTDIGAVIAEVAVGGLAALAIDMPIGLPAHEPRACDVEARRHLGERRSSVFPAPVRAVLGAGSYDQALVLSRAASGRGLSRQAFNLVPRIAELDAVVRPELQDRVVEAHPELAFTRLAGRPPHHAKRTAEGRAERLVLLAAAGLDGLANVRVLGAAPDDVLDAAALVVTAARIRAGTAERLGDGARDVRGLRMEVAW